MNNSWKTADNTLPPVNARVCNRLYVDPTNGRTYVDNPSNNRQEVVKVYYEDNNIPAVKYVNASSINPFINEKGIFSLPDANIYILAGQSNANGYLSDIDSVRSDYSIYIPSQGGISYIYDTTNGMTDYFTDSFEELQHRPEASAMKGFGPELSLGYDISAGGISNVVIIKVSKGSTSLANNWNVAAIGDMYDRLKSRIDRTLELLAAGNKWPKLRGFLWVQGETDTGDMAEANAYYANLTNLFSDFRSRYADIGGNDLKFVLTRTQLHSGITDRNIEQGVVRQAQGRYGWSQDNAEVLTIDDFRLNNINNTGGSDFGSHYLNDELIVVGKRAAASLLKSENTQTYYWGFRNYTGGTQTVFGTWWRNTVGNPIWYPLRYTDGNVISSTSGTTFPAHHSTIGYNPTRIFDDTSRTHGVISLYRAPADTPAIDKHSGFILRAPFVDPATNRKAGLIEESAFKPITYNMLQSLSFYLGNSQSAYGDVRVMLHTELDGWFIGGQQDNFRMLSAMANSADFPTLSELKTLNFSTAVWRSFEFQQGTPFSHIPPASNENEMPTNPRIIGLAFHCSHEGRVDPHCIFRLDHIKLVVNK